MSTELVITGQNALVEMDLSQLPATYTGTAEDLEALQGGGFLPRLNFWGKTTERGKGDVVRGGHYELQKDNDNHDFGDNVLVVPFCMRDKVMEFKDDNTPLIYYDKTSTLFQDVKARALQKPPNGETNNCYWGYSFLLFIPELRTLAELFFRTKTSRPKSGDLFECCPKTPQDIERGLSNEKDPRSPLPCHLSSRLVNNKSFSYYVPVIKAANIPVKNLPTKLIAPVMTEFMTAKDRDVEEDDSTDDRDR